MIRHRAIGNPVVAPLKRERRHIDPERAGAGAMSRRGSGDIFRQRPDPKRRA